MYAYCNVDSNDYAGVNRANRIKALYKYILAKVLGINVTIPNPFGDFILNQLEGIEESLRKKQHLQLKNSR